MFLVIPQSSFLEFPRPWSGPRGWPWRSWSRCCWRTRSGPCQKLKHKTEILRDCSCSSGTLDSVIILWLSCVRAWDSPVNTSRRSASVGTSLRILPMSSKNSRNSILPLPSESTCRHFPCKRKHFLISDLQENISLNIKSWESDKDLEGSTKRLDNAEQKIL